MKFRKYFLLMALSLAGCASTQGQNVQEATVSSIGQQANLCHFEAYQVEKNGTGTDEYGIFDYIVKENSRPVPAKDRKVMGDIYYSAGPAAYANLSGNFEEFGKRKIHNDSNNSDLTVNIVYHVKGSEGASEQMKTLGCE